jgi:hypothetical protein
MHKIVENRVLYYEIKISEQRINDALIVLTISEWYFSIAIVNGSSLHLLVLGAFKLLSWLFPAQLLRHLLNFRSFLPKQSGMSNRMTRCILIETNMY